MFGQVPDVRRPVPRGDCSWWACPAAATVGPTARPGGR